MSSNKRLIIGFLLGIVSLITLVSLNVVDYTKHSISANSSDVNGNPTFSTSVTIFYNSQTDPETLNYEISLHRVAQNASQSDCIDGVELYASNSLPASLVGYNVVIGSSRTVNYRYGKPLICGDQALGVSSSQTGTLQLRLEPPPYNYPYDQLKFKL